MIKSIISTAFILLITGISFAKNSAVPNPHDSLLYDGENNISTKLIPNSDDDCELRVIYVSGKPEGVVKKRTIYEICGAADTVTVYENGVLERNTIIKEGEWVKTGPNSTAMIQLPDGSVIYINKGSEFQFSSELCKDVKEMTKYPAGILKIGSIWTKIKKALGGGKFEVSTERACACVRGTEFTLEVKEENGVKTEILKVYESTVDFELRNPDLTSVNDNAAVMQKAAEDYQNGKISMDELIKITEEYSKKVNSETKDFNKKVEVNAGMMSVLKGNEMSVPVPFNTNEDRWFDVNMDN
jgi:hypothetical protein